MTSAVHPRLCETLFLVSVSKTVAELDLDQEWEVEMNKREVKQVLE